MRNKRLSFLISELQLELPFFTIDVDLPTADVVDFPSKVQWTDDEIIQLHERMLPHYIRLLKDGRASEVIKCEITDWMEGTEEGPFSFQACCIASECDPQEMRLVIKDYLRRSSK